MKVRVVKSFKIQGAVISAGTVLDVADDLLSPLNALVEPLPQYKQDKGQNWRPTPQAWLQGGELRTTGVFFSLASEIVKLTSNDLPMQRRLLEEHCQEFSLTHIFHLFEEWEKRASFIEHNRELSRYEAEEEAAKAYYLTAWLHDFRRRN